MNFDGKSSSTTKGKNVPLFNNFAIGLRFENGEQYIGMR